MYEINKSYNRPNPELIQQLSKFSSPIIGDAMGRYGCMESYIKPLDDSMHIFGPAFTVQTYRADNLLCHLAIEMAEPGDVLVIDACGFTETGLWGELMTIMAQKRGIAGIVINGAVRDKLAIIESGFPVFAKAISPMGGFKASPGSLNIPIACAGVKVLPGDIIIGDADGVAVVPNQKAYMVLQSCITTEEKETQIQKRMEQGETLFSIFNLGEAVKKAGLENVGVK